MSNRYPSLGFMIAPDPAAHRTDGRSGAVDVARTGQYSVQGPTSFSPDDLTFASPAQSLEELRAEMERSA
ncbi:hypothetical protein XTPLMG728_1206 [Xanthomonas translucens pv. poae]|jgi:hypothetical protein|uniref:Uncharacterized protein n=1 Tax=Xanthomonas graminis pv. poae TaxID=227946 RepID=A0A0K2ZN31_9XANT|nr:hypothetical protein XTPLMG728_1206 [Xanthomonas translucens pv. poae]